MIIRSNNTQSLSYRLLEKKLVSRNHSSNMLLSNYQQNIEFLYGDRHSISYGVQY